MRFAEILRENIDTNALYSVFRNLQGEANQEKKALVLHYGPFQPVQGAINKDLNEIMSNIGYPQFTGIDDINVVYDDPKFKDIIEEFDSDKIVIKTDASLPGKAEQPKDDTGNKLAAMATNATNTAMSQDLTPGDNTEIS